MRPVFASIFNPGGNPSAEKFIGRSPVAGDVVEKRMARAADRKFAAH